MFTKILGANVEIQARSPLIWNTLYEKLGIDSNMFRKNELGEGLGGEITQFIMDKDYRAILLAAPLKELALKHLSEMGYCSSSNLISINLIYKVRDDIHCVSTDGFGALASLGLGSGKKDFIVFGFGGTSKSIINAIERENLATHLTIVTRQSSNLIKWNLPHKYSPYEEISEDLSKADILINATSLGNSKDANRSPLSESEFNQVRHGARLLDVNYTMSRSTKFLEYGRRFGLKGIDGSLMNLMQALFALKLAHPEVTQTVEELRNLENWDNV